MFGWDFKVIALSRFWNCNMFKIFELWNVILWYELNPWVRCAFGNVSTHFQHIKNGMQFCWIRNFPNFLATDASACEEEATLHEIKRNLSTYWNCISLELFWSNNLTTTWQVDLFHKSLLSLKICQSLIERSYEQGLVHSVSQ